jgi:hypothetical protein
MPEANVPRRGVGCPEPGLGGLTSGLKSVLKRCAIEASLHWRYFIGEKSGLPALGSLGGGQGSRFFGGRGTLWRH